MNMSDIACFLKVVEYMSFSKAAEAMYFSQQAVSHHIKHLESTYNVTLFERKPSLRLTEEGKILLAAAKDIQEQEEALLELLHSKKQTFNGELSIGLPPNRSTAFATDFIPLFAQQFPNMTIRLMEATTAQLPIAVKDNLVDLALPLLSHPFSPYASDIYVQTPLEDEDLYVIISKKLFWQHFGEAGDALAGRFAKGVSLYEFHDLPMFLHPETSGLHRKILAAYTGRGYRPFIRVKTTLTSSLINLCAAGHGIFFSNPMLLKYLYIQQPQLFRALFIFPITEFQKTRQTVLIYHQKKRLSYPMLESIEIIKKVYASHASIMDTLLPEQSSQSIFLLE